MTDTNDDLDLLDEIESLTSDSQETKPEPAKPVEAKKAPEPDKELLDGEIVIVNPLEGEGNIQDILSFDNLDIAIKEQAGLYAYYGEAAARGQKQYNRAKQNLEKVEANVDRIIRQKWEVSTHGKMTEKAVDARVRMSKAYARAQECVNDARYIYSLCNSVSEAFNQREQMLIQSCKRAELEMGSMSGFKGRNVSREERDEGVKNALKKRSTAQ